MTYEGIKLLFEGCEAYLVGGGARHVLAKEPGEPRDWDVVVTRDFPLSLQRHFWRENSFGGRKYVNLSLDVWRDDIGCYLREVPRGKDGVAIHLETGAVLTTKEFWLAFDWAVVGRPVRLRPAG